jgi:hypothetical protein
MLSMNGQAAVRSPDLSGPVSDDQPVTLSIRPLPPRRVRSVPADLRRALAKAGASLDHLDPADIRHLVHMITEASRPGIRARRVEAAVLAARRQGARW